MSNGRSFRPDGYNGGSSIPRGPQHAQPVPQTVQIQLPPIETLSSYHCPNCLNNVFQPAIRIWEISALISPTGIAQPANQQVWQCLGCGIAWNQEHLKKLSPQEREELVSKIKAQAQGQTQGPLDEATV